MPRMTESNGGASASMSERGEASISTSTASMSSSLHAWCSSDQPNVALRTSRAPSALSGKARNAAMSPLVTHCRPRSKSPMSEVGRCCVK